MAYEINISGYIGADDYYIFGDGGFSLKTLNELLSEMPKDETEINILINSGGGLVSEGFAIYDKLMSLPQTINTTVLGMCGSIATVIAQAGKKGTRKMYENSDYFIHMPYWTPTAPDAYESEDLRKLSEELQKSEQKILKLYVSSTGGEEAALKEKMSAATSLSANEAKEMGFVDEVIMSAISNQVKYNIAAFTGVQLKKFKNDNTMADIQKELKDFKADITKTLSALKNLIKPANFKNAVVHTSEGAAVYYDGELNVGTKVYTDEAMTIPCADGDYAIGENMHVVKDGEVIEIKEGIVDEKQKEIDALKEQLAAATTELENAKSELEIANANVQTAVEGAAEIETKFEAFKKTIQTGEKLKVENNQDFNREGDAPKGAPTVAEIKAAQEARRLKASKKK